MSGTSSRTRFSLSSLGSFSISSSGADVHEQRVAAAQLDVEHLLGELGHALLVGPGEDDAAPLVLELLLEGDHLAGELPVPDEDHVQRLVQHDLVALADMAGSMSGWRVTRILRPLENTSTVPSSLTPRKVP